MFTLINWIKNLFLDLFAMGKGLIYGFTLMGLLILIGTGLLYGMLALRNLLLY